MRCFWREVERYLTLETNNNKTILMKLLSKSLLPLVLAIFIIGLPSVINAQKSLQDLADLKENKWDKSVKSYKNNSTWIDQLQGLLNEDLLKEENLPNPKKNRSFDHANLGQIRNGKHYINILNNVYNNYNNIVFKKLSNGSRK